MRHRHQHLFIEKNMLVFFRAAVGRMCQWCREFEAETPVLPTESCGSVGWSHARRARVAQRSIPWLDLTQRVRHGFP